MKFNAKSATVTDSGGQYVIPFLAPGQYDLTVEAAGFRAAVRRAIQLGSGDHPVIDIQLAVGDLSQKIEVVDESPLVNTENASTGQSITAKQVADLPLNGRTPLMLAQLSMGVISTT